MFIDMAYYFLVDISRQTGYTLLPRSAHANKSGCGLNFWHAFESNLVICPSPAKRHLEHCISFRRHGAAAMSYQYFHLHPQLHRDVAHWRGARGGMRVLSLPSCSGWLRRQANDASYDFWPDLRIGSHLMRERRAAAIPPRQLQAVFIMHRDAEGDWACERWPVAANHGEAALAAGDTASALPQKARARAAPVAGEDAATTSFIIEIGAARAS